jgi:hypothetical protein
VVTSAGADLDPVHDGDGRRGGGWRGRHGGSGVDGEGDAAHPAARRGV